MASPSTTRSASWLSNPNPNPNPNPKPKPKPNPNQVDLFPGIDRFRRQLQPDRRHLREMDLLG